jgi:YHS domain-containing protein
MRMIQRPSATASALLLSFSFVGGAHFAPQPALAEPPAQAPAEKPAEAKPAEPPAAPKPAPTRNTKEWNLPSKGKPAIDGYDPVAYFPEFGGKATKGKAEFATNHGGVIYWFASADHRAAFLKDPARFEPAHGGWCSYAIVTNDKVEIDAESFIVKDGRLFLFYDGFGGDAKAKWLKKDHQQQADSADKNWKKISGEEPRR